MASTDHQLEASLSDHPADLDQDDTRAPSPKRRRTAHACDNCRARKTRCDGQTPCSTCRASELACTHETTAASKGKSDLILAAVLRMERSLEHVSSQITNRMPVSPSSDLRSSSRGVTHAASIQESNPISPGHVAPDYLDAAVTSPRFSTWLANIENASLSRLHTSTTESILAWPHFDCYPELRNAHWNTSASIFNLEQGRSTSSTASAVSMLPLAGRHEIESVIGTFQENINFWYPTLAKSRLDSLMDKIIHSTLGADCESCLALLVMALGYACDATISSIGRYDKVDAIHLTDAPTFDSERALLVHSHSRKMGQLYFECALSRLSSAFQELTTSALLCLLFTAFYHASAQRPLQAWSLINAAATKCRVLLSYKPLGNTPDDEECVNRVFWACFILESDYLAELSALPLSGIADMESSVRLPGSYHTHDSIAEEEESALYFLACISMRRLLNRVHNLLYAKDTGANLDDSRFPNLVAELDHQLEEWREWLPSRFQFSLDTLPAPNAQAGFLRQRYLTCRSVIYRPYLTRMLGVGHLVSQEDIRAKCGKCLDACVDHILNLRGFPHTVFMDTWICSLSIPSLHFISMAAAMLILLAALRVPSVKGLVRPEATILGHHLQGLLETWADIPAKDLSPSIQWAIRLITVADRLIKNQASGNHMAYHSSARDNSKSFLQRYNGNGQL